MFLLDGVVRLERGLYPPLFRYLFARYIATKMTTTIAKVPAISPRVAEIAIIVELLEDPVAPVSLSVVAIVSVDGLVAIVGADDSVVAVVDCSVVSAMAVVVSTCTEDVAAILLMTDVGGTESVLPGTATLVVFIGTIVGFDTIVDTGVVVGVGAAVSGADVGVRTGVLVAIGLAILVTGVVVDTRSIIFTRDVVAALLVITVEVSIGATLSAVVEGAAALVVLGATDMLVVGATELVEVGATNLIVVGATELVGVEAADVIVVGATELSVVRTADVIVVGATELSVVRTADVIVV